MKLVCAQSALSSNLSLVSRAVASRPSLPVLANILLTADEKTQQVSLCAFDLSLGILTTFAAQVETGGKLTLPARLLSDIVSRLPDGDLVLADDTEDNPDNPTYLTTITASSGRYQVHGMSADEFPELPVIEGQTVQLPVEALLAGLHGSLFAASPDETKQVLTGIHLTIQADGLEFAATDGHRLAVVQTVDDAADPKEELSVTIPSKALQELMRMLEKDASETVAVTFDQNQATFEWAAQRLTSRLLEGQYPNYEQLIPRQFGRQLSCDRKQLLSSLERIAVLADQKNNIVKLSLSPDQEITLSVEAQDVGSARETLPAQITGDELDIAFNVRYLMDGLKALTSTEVQMQLNTATSPAILTPLGDLKMTYLVMPVQIRS